MPDQTTYVTAEPPEYLKRPYWSYLDTAMEIAGQPYTPYGGPRIAGFTPDQASAFQGFQSAPTAGLEQAMQGAGLMRRGAQTWANTDQSRYINPYMKAAIDPAARELGLNFQKQQAQLGGQAAMNNAFGGSRQALLESRLSKDYNQNMSDLYATGLASAYESGANIFGQDQSRLLAGGQGLAGIGQQLQNMNITGNTALLESGGIQQAMNQANLDLGYQDFIDQRDWPLRNLNIFGNALGVPTYTPNQTQQTNVAGPSGFSQILGGVAGGLGVLGKGIGLYSSMFGGS